MAATEMQTSMRGGPSVKFLGGGVQVEYGKVSFIKEGKEYDLNKIMARKSPRPMDASYAAISDGIIIAGVTLKYPGDFHDSDAVDWAETVAYRQEKQRRADEAKANAEAKAHAEAKAKTLEEEKRKKEAESKPLDCKQAAHTKKPITLSGYYNSSLGADVYESKEIVAIKYPNLKGRYINNMNGMNLNKLISELMTEEQRDEFFINYEKGGFPISVSGIPKSVGVAGYLFESDHATGTKTVTRV